jgi:hypothetical protein
MQSPLPEHLSGHGSGTKVTTLLAQLVSVDAIWQLVLETQPPPATAVHQTQVRPGKTPETQALQPLKDEQVSGGIAHDGPEKPPVQAHSFDELQLPWFEQ